MLGTQQALEEARTKMTTAGSTLQNASDAIQVAENRAREVRSMGWGVELVSLGEMASVLWRARLMPWAHYG